MSNSISVTLKPADSRCRYWAKIVRKGAALPLPSAVDCANDIPAAYSRKGDEELFPGDFLFEGEEESHRKARGWGYWLSYCNDAGEMVRINRPGAAEKATLKAAGIPSEYLAGAGGVAALVRCAHGLRLGLPVTPTEEN